MSARSVIVDTDPGIDDALAIAYGLRSKRLKVQAITTVFGNATVRRTTENLIRLLCHIRIDRWPKIGAGAGRPLCGRRNTYHGPHGTSGLGDSALAPCRNRPTVYNAVDLMLETLDGGIADTIICLGPLTNIALLLRQHSSISKRIKRIFMMAGALASKGTVTEWAETNAYRDPEALDIVLRSDIPKTLVTLDVTRIAILPEETIVRWQKKKKEPFRSIATMAFYSFRYHRQYRQIAGCLLHDPLCMALAEDEGLGQYRECGIRVDLKEKRGMVTLDASRSAAHTRYCAKIDVDTFLRRFIRTIEGYT